MRSSTPSWTPSPSSTRAGTADPGGHHRHRQVRAPGQSPEAQGRSLQRPERQAPRQGGGDRRPGRSPRRRHHRHEHGRPRHGHHPGRQPRVPRPEGGRARIGGVAVHPGEDEGAVRGREEEGPRRGRPLHPRHGAARLAAHRPAAARSRRSPGRPRRLEVLPLHGGRPDAPLRRRAGPRPHGSPGLGEGGAPRTRHDLQRPSSGPRRRWRTTTTRFASRCSSTTTS